MIIKKNYKYISILIAFTAIVLCLDSCSTKKNTFFSRTYHNITSRYNGYFNGNESMKEGIAEVEKKHVDNYEKILPVFKYGDEQVSKSISAQTERAYKKASMVIQRHSILIKGTEYCKWIDRCYFLIGKSHFYKRDYLQALEAFDYVVKEYKNSPVKYQAMLWNAQCYIQLKNWDKAQFILDYIQDKVIKNSKDKILIRDFPAVYADYHIYQENYSLAIPHLNKAIEVNHKRNVKSRCKFILAQIYQKLGKLNKASELYLEVIKMNPPYEMAFNAKINMAKCFNPEGSDSKEIKKILTKMLKEEKNKDFRDQIYYALAEIALKEDNIKDAIKYLKLSAACSTKNNYQKTASFLKLANIYFDQRDYIPAEAYFDSTVAILPKDHKDYETIVTKKKVLSELVKNLKTVQLEDSLQQLSKMKPAEREKIIAKKINDIIKEEQRKKQEEMQKQHELANLTYNNQLLASSNNSQWYFYNNTSISMGVAEFMKKWGNRKLEDNWRLANKQTFNDFGDNDSTGMETSDKNKKTIENDPKDKKTYLKTIPVTKEQLEASTDKIIEALYNIGTIYKESLNEYDKAADAYEDLLERYPDNKYKLSCYYQLYLIYIHQKKKNKADYYKNILLTKYPEYPYSKIIADPDYIGKSEENQKAEKMYESTYDSYSNGDFQKVISDCNQAEISLKGNTLIPKFYFIRALSYGRMQDTVRFKSSLNEIITKFPFHEVKKASKNMLEAIEQIKQNKIIASTVKENKSIYKIDYKTIHFYIMLIPAKKVNMSSLISALNDFNKNNYSDKNLTVNSKFFNDEIQLVSIINFDNKDKAMDYFNIINNSQDIKSKIENQDYKQFIISVDNFTIMTKTKNINEYLEFYKSYYQ